MFRPETVEFKDAVGANGQFDKPREWNVEGVCTIGAHGLGRSELGLGRRRRPVRKRWEGCQRRVLLLCALWN